MTFRLVADRALLGSAAWMVAGIAPLGLGSALGIIGSQYLEVQLRRNAKHLFGEK
ncbi:phage holin family protein [Burkholderia ubonensis]|uniref:phage holin family protein n=1 Tax=Burkholderia ubonensis TaxID=101571 RepID=UPI00210B61E4|nr:phage holin family protein [Burkholderia ubonensis]